MKRWHSWIAIAGAALGAAACSSMPAQAPPDLTFTVEAFAIPANAPDAAAE